MNLNFWTNRHETALRLIWVHNVCHFCLHFWGPLLHYKMKLLKLKDDFYHFSGVQIIEPHHEKTCSMQMQNQRRRSAAQLHAQLISAFVFATQIVQSLYFVNLKFQASSHLLCLYSPVCPTWSETPMTGFLRMQHIWVHTMAASASLASWSCLS